MLSYSVGNSVNKVLFQLFPNCKEKLLQDYQSFLLFQLLASMGDVTTFLNDETADETFIQLRLLLNNGSAITMRSPVLIAWYCFIISVSVPVLFCGVYCWYTRYQAHRRTQHILDRELQYERDLAMLSRIEANILVFSDAEKFRRTKMMRAAISEQVKVSPNLPTYINVHECTL